MRNTLKSLQNVCIAAALILTPAVASAGEITLTSADETVRIRGEFVGFQEQAYVIRYRSFELVVPAANMRCDGDDCPRFGPKPQDIASLPES